VTAADQSDGASLVSVDHLKLYFPVREGIVFRHEVAHVHAVDDVTLRLQSGQTLGLVASPAAASQHWRAASCVSGSKPRLDLFRGARHHPREQPGYAAAPRVRGGSPGRL
jgi:ABC-type microcin C transport system duplicated ATPase subunit YejF